MGFHYRIYNNTRPYFLTIKVIDSIPLFNDEENRSCVIDSLEFCQRVKGLRLNAWCLMPDTLYLIAIAEEGKDLPGIIRDLKNYTSKKLVRLIKQSPGPETEIILKKMKKAGAKNRKCIEYKVWEDGYFPDELFSTDYIVKKLEYIHMAPVKHNIVCRAWDYNYSSARTYLDMGGLLKVVKL
jgi:putative transposase